MTVKDALSALPCFTQVENISIMASGLSQHCFKVSADNKVYFAKTINDTAEASVTAYASILGLSPNVIYHDSDWLISNFVNASNLALSTIDTDNKIAQAIKLMVKCHQLDIKPAELSTKNITNSLIDNAHYSLPIKTALLQFSELLLVPMSHLTKSVCCHGDLNFSNVLMNKAQRTWLVDYECACTAPLEYDLAMFIAVNSLTSNEITIMIKQYEFQSAVYVDLLLLNHYLLFCYFINGLWYFNTAHEKAHAKDKLLLLQHSKEQCLALQSALNISDSPLLSRLGIKFTNILATFDFSNQT